MLFTGPENDSDIEGMWKFSLKTYRHKGEFLIIHCIILNEDKYLNNGKDSLYTIFGSLHKHFYIYSTKPEQFRAEDKCWSFL